MARKEKNIHYLYKTTCNVTGRWYIGMHSTSDLDDGYMGSGKRLRYSIRKYGVENHVKEILGFFETRDLLVEAEKKVITEEMIADKNCMNLKEGGYGGWVSPEVQIKCSKAGGKASMLKYWTDENYKKAKLNGLKKALIKLVELGSDCVNTRFKDKKHSEETKQKMSEKRKGTGTGETNSQYGTCWITKNGINKKIKKEDLENYLNEGWVKGRK
ncbi:MAG: hypothetical protein E6R13_01805 [Spirochaetes bacterium]|nr:MAG: hypothetical protein E6R13_01805 [Spirochaetota bacterium]